LDVRLFNLSGIEVAQWPVVSGFAGEETRLVLPKHLPDGIYFMQIHDNNGS
jgi:hypothetical protein